MDSQWATMGRAWAHRINYTRSKGLTMVTHAQQTMGASARPVLPETYAKPKHAGVEAVCTSACLLGDFATLLIGI